MFSLSLSLFYFFYILEAELKEKYISISMNILSRIFVVDVSKHNIFFEMNAWNFFSFLFYNISINNIKNKQYILPRLIIIII